MNEALAVELQHWSREEKWCINLTTAFSFLNTTNTSTERIGVIFVKLDNNLKIQQSHSKT